MEFIRQCITYVQLHWVEIGVSLWLVEQAMRAVSKLTPWVWDDNLVDVFTNAIAKLFPKKKKPSA